MKLRELKQLATKCYPLDHDVWPTVGNMGLPCPKEGPSGFIRSIFVAYEHAYGPHWQRNSYARNPTAHLVLHPEYYERVKDTYPMRVLLDKEEITSERESRFEISKMYVPYKDLDDGDLRNQTQQEKDIHRLIWTCCSVPVGEDCEYVYRQYMGGIVKYPNPFRMPNNEKYAISCSKYEW